MQYLWIMIHKKVMDWHLLMVLLIELQWGKGSGGGVPIFERKPTGAEGGFKKVSTIILCTAKVQKNKGHKF